MKKETELKVGDKVIITRMTNRPGRRDDFIGNKEVTVTQIDRDWFDFEPAVNGVNTCSKDFGDTYKLAESEKVEESRVFKVGDKVKFIDKEGYDEKNSPLWGGAYGKIPGEITKDDGTYYYRFKVVFENGKSNIFRPDDLEPLEEKPIEIEYYRPEFRTLGYGMIEAMSHGFKVHEKKESLNIKDKVMDYLGSVSRAIKKTLNPRVKLLLKHGLLDEELNLTGTGRQVVDEALLEQKFIMESLDTEAKELEKESKKT